MPINTRYALQKRVLACSIQTRIRIQVWIKNLILWVFEKEGESKPQAAERVNLRVVGRMAQEQNVGLY